MSDMLSKGTEDVLTDLSQRVFIGSLYLAVRESGLELEHRVSVDNAVTVYGGFQDSVNRITGYVNRGYKWFIPALVARDIDYRYGEGTLLDFQRVNQRFDRNLTTCVKILYKWWNPKRYFMLARANRCARESLDDFGTYAEMVLPNMDKKQSQGTGTPEAPAEGDRT
jgi:hypothetical protein